MQGGECREVGAGRWVQGGVQGGVQRRGVCRAAVERLQSGRGEGARMQTRAGRGVERGTATVAAKAGHPATAAVAATATAAEAAATAAVAATTTAAAATAATTLTAETGHPSAVTATAAATHATAHATAAHATAHATATAATLRRRRHHRRCGPAAAAAARRGAVGVCEVLAAVAEQEVEQQRLAPLVHVGERAHLYGHKRALLGLRACFRVVTGFTLGSGGGCAPCGGSACAASRAGSGTAP